MPRAPTTADVFNAIAEPRRRDLIDALARAGPSPVGDLVRAVRLPQPAVSKHLGVLRAVGVVRVEKQGRQRLYSLEPTELKPVHDWIAMYERLWNHQAEFIKARAERLARERGRTPPNPPREEHP